VPVVELSDQRAFQGLADEPLRRFFFAVNLPADGVRLDPAMVKSVSEVPSWDLTHLTQNQGAYRAVYPDRRSLAQFTVTFYETVRSAADGFFQEWQGRIISPEGYHSPSSAYKRVVEIERLDNANVPVLTRRYLGAVPLSIRGFGMDVGEEGLVTPSITFVAEGFADVRRG
jgi:hypothetical protein